PRNPPGSVSSPPSRSLSRWRKPQGTDQVCGGGTGAAGTIVSLVRSSIVPLKTSISTNPAIPSTVANNENGQLTPLGFCVRPQTFGMWDGCPSLSIGVALYSSKLEASPISVAPGLPGSGTGRWILGYWANQSG